MKECKDLSLAFFHLDLSGETFTSEADEMKKAVEDLLLPFQAFCMLQRSGGSEGGGGGGGIHGVHGRNSTILEGKAVVWIKQRGLADVGSTFVEERSDAVAIQSRGTVLEGLHGRR